MVVVQAGMSDRILIQNAGKVRGLRFAGAPPLLSSAGTSWAGPVLEQHTMRSAEGVGESGPVAGERGMLVIADGLIDVTLREDGREVVYHARRGCVSLLSGDCRPHVVRLQGNALAIALRLGKQWFERLLLEDAPLSFGRGEPFVYDPTVLALVCLMRDEVAGGAVTGRLYAESLTVALLSHVVEHLAQPVLEARGSLSEQQQRRLRHFIRDNLGEDLSLVDLAQLIGRSPRQFSTLFKQAFGTTPHRYLLLARLAEGARQLAQRDTSIAEIAHRLGFSSQSHFASAFRAVYGETPRSYLTGKRALRPI